MDYDTGCLPGASPPPVLSFRLVHTAPIEHFQPNADLLFRYH